MEAGWDLPRVTHRAGPKRLCTLSGSHSCPAENSCPRGRGCNSCCPLCEPLLSPPLTTGRGQGSWGATFPTSERSPSQPLRKASGFLSPDLASDPVFHASICDFRSDFVGRGSRPGEGSDPVSQMSLVWDVCTPQAPRLTLFPPLSPVHPPIVQSSSSSRPWRPSCSLGADGGLGSAGVGTVSGTLRVPFHTAPCVRPPAPSPALQEKSPGPQVPS